MQPCYDGVDIGRAQGAHRSPVLPHSMSRRVEGFSTVFANTDSAEVPLVQLAACGCGWVGMCTVCVSGAWCCMQYSDAVVIKTCMRRGHNVCSCRPPRPFSPLLSWWRPQGPPPNVPHAPMGAPYPPPTHTPPRRRLQARRGARTSTHTQAPVQMPYQRAHPFPVPQPRWVAHGWQVCSEADCRADSPIPLIALSPPLSVRVPPFPIDVAGGC